jgi:very-short-patch-repair endonuclease
MGADRLILARARGQHASRSSFERDRRRDAELATKGIRVLRVTWQQITDERETLVATLARALPP